MLLRHCYNIVCLLRYFNEHIYHQFLNCTCHRYKTDSNNISIVCEVLKWHVITLNIDLFDIYMGKCVM